MISIGDKSSDEHGVVNEWFVKKFFISEWYGNKEFDIAWF